METMRWFVSVTLRHYVVICLKQYNMNSLISSIVLRIPILFRLWLYIYTGHCKLWFSQGVRKSSGEEGQLLAFLLFKVFKH
jgi:hypothetical protein